MSSIPYSSSQILMKHEFSGQIFEKYSNKTFHANPSNGSRFVPCGPTEGKTDVTKLVIAFRNFVYTPKNVIPVAFRVKWKISKALYISPIFC